MGVSRCAPDVSSLQLSLSPFPKAITLPAQLFAYFPFVLVAPHFTKLTPALLHLPAPKFSLIFLPWLNPILPFPFQSSPTQKLLPSSSLAWLWCSPSRRSSSRAGRQWPASHDPRVLGRGGARGAAVGAGVAAARQRRRLLPHRRSRRAPPPRPALHRVRPRPPPALFHLLLCNAHLAAGPRTAVSDHRDGAAAKAEAGDPDKVSGGRSIRNLEEALKHEYPVWETVGLVETHRVVSIGSEICEQDHDDDDGGHPRAADRSSITARSSSSDDAGGGGGPLVSLFELSPIIAPPRAGGDGSVDQATAPEELVAVDGGGERLTVGKIVSSLRAQRRELEALRAELASERRARAEAEERRRQLEEQGELDREAARLAMQLVHESETEKHGLQRQLDACRVRAQLYHQSEVAAMDDDDGNGGGGEGGCFREANGGDGNNYQSLVDFLPGSVYSSSPDLANLLKLYTESGNGGFRRRRDDYDEPAIAVVEEEEEEVAVAITVTAATESSGSVEATTAIVTESLHERSTGACRVETVAEAA